MILPFSGSYPVTQRFGENPAAYAQFGMKGHNGIDYGLTTGTPVLAATDGVAQVLSDPPGFGTYVEITGAQYKTVYAHLKSASVTSGQSVRAGQQIGLSNNTGNSSGPHLHFGAKPINPDKTNGYFGAIDPAPLFNQGATTMPSSQDKTDDLAVRLAYNLAFLRQPSEAEIRARSGKQTQEQLDRELLESGERDQIEADRAYGIRARSEDWAGQIERLKKQVADKGTALAPGTYVVK